MLRLRSAHLLEGVLGAAGPAVEAYPAALTLVLDIVVRYVEIPVTEGAEACRTVGEVPAAYARSLVLDARIRQRQHILAPDIRDAAQGALYGTRRRIDGEERIVGVLRFLTVVDGHIPAFGGVVI